MKYITIEGGEDFRTIARRLSDKGMKMNHATARSYLMVGMGKFLSELSRELGSQLTEEQVTALVKSQETHEILADILPLCK